jgi:hypothetical protein
LKLETFNRSRIACRLSVSRGHTHFGLHSKAARTPAADDKTTLSPLATQLWQLNLVNGYNNIIQEKSAIGQ